MHTQMQTTWILGFALVLLSQLTSCSEGGGFDIEKFPVPRSTRVWIVPIGFDNESEPYASSAPFEIATALSASLSFDDRGWLTWTKAELDFDDGAGWQDMTSAIQTLWWHTPEDADPFDTSYMTHHVYQATGSYTIRGRVTYWTGETVSAEAGDVITVLP